MQTNEQKIVSENSIPESDVWQQLLTTREQASLARAQASSAPTILPVSEAVPVVPPLAGDPWSTLLSAQGVQVVDLQQTRLSEVHASLNEQDVEQALYFMQEQMANEG